MVKHTEDKGTFKDPVCGMEVSQISAIAESQYQGRSFYFCAGVCKEAFDADPEKYAGKKRPHRMKMP